MTMDEFDTILERIQGPIHDLATAMANELKDMIQSTLVDAHKALAVDEGDKDWDNIYRPAIAADALDQIATWCKSQAGGWQIVVGQNLPPA